MRELYKAKPDREIIHAHGHVLTPGEVASRSLVEEHIVIKVDRLANALLDLGDRLSSLAAGVEIETSAEEIVGLSRGDIQANGWLHYPELARLAQVAPLSMTQQAFLSRCKSIHELWQRIPNAVVRRLMMAAGHQGKDTKGLQSLRLLQALTNHLERLNAEGESSAGFGSEPVAEDLNRRNANLAALFLNNDLRIADAHDAGGVFGSLEAIGFDIGGLNDGYGRALDHVIDGVSSAFGYINDQLSQLLDR